MGKHLFPGVGVLFLLTSSSAQAQAPRIDHQPVACAAAEKFPRLEARFAPAEAVATARVVFQGANPQEWYSVAMKSEGDLFAGILPKPKKSLKSFRYYIEVTDKTLGTNRTVDHTTTVVDSTGACKGKIMAGAIGSASVILQGPAGIAALPAGFASTGVVAAGSAAGSSAGTAGAGVGGGGGMSTGAIAGLVGVGAAAVAVVAVKASGEGGRANTLEGHVYRNAGQSPISGATVSTSLDSRTATTDGSGHFFLETATAGNVQVYRVTVTATGCQTYSNESGWGAHPSGLTLHLTCP